MSITVTMPTVESCAATKCTYNQSGECHARAITISLERASPPVCGTYLQGAQPHTKRRQRAGVGACQATACLHNEDYECRASAIEVGLSQDEPVCGTFEERD